MASNSYLEIKTVDGKFKTLRDLENGLSNKDVYGKYFVPKNTVFK